VRGEGVEEEWEKKKRKKAPLFFVREKENRGGNVLQGKEITIKVVSRLCQAMQSRKSRDPHFDAPCVHPACIGHPRRGRALALLFHNIVVVLDASASNRIHFRSSPALPSSDRL
jgi:hypothetical protein